MNVKTTKTSVSLLCILIFGIFLPCSLNAQNVARFPEEVSSTDFTVQHALTTEDGLPANGVNDILQDQQKYLWAATYNGIVRYNGDGFKIFNTSTVPGMTSSRFLSIAEGPDGIIWAGMEQNTLVKIGDDTTRVYDIAKTNKYENVNALKPVGDNKVWVGTSNGLYLFTNGKFKKITSVPNDQINAIKQLSDKLYVVYKKGLFRLSKNGEIEQQLLKIEDDWQIKGEGFTVHELSDAKNNLSDILIEDDGIIVVLHTGIVRIRDHRYDLLLDRSHIPNQLFIGITKHNSQDKYYIYGSEGLISAENMGTTRMEITNYSGYKIGDALVDHEGSVWIATKGHGLRQFIRTPVYQGDKYRELRETPLLAVTKGQNDALWVGSNCEGLYRYSNGTATNFDATDGLTNTCVWSLESTDNGMLWVGTWGNGLFYRMPDQRRFKHMEHPALDSVSVVLSLYKDQSGALWIGSYKNGLYRYREGTIKDYSKADGSMVRAIRQIFQDDKGRIWLATDGGVGYVKDGKIVIPEKFDRLKTKNFRTIARDSTGRFWFGSYGGGMIVYNPKNDNIRTITQENGLQDETVSQLTFDREENLWLAGNKGIFYVEKNQLDAYLNNTSKRLRVIDLGNRKGLHVRETSGGFQPSQYLDKNGRLYIPLVQGLAVVNTQIMKVNRQPPNVEIDQITIDGKDHNPKSVGKLQHNVRRLVFSFSAMSYVNPEDVQFRYRLEGFDNKWKQVRGNRKAVYTSLTPGEYTLKVKASNNNGVWSRESASVDFTIQPPFWQTTWFYMLASLMFLALIYGVYQFRVYSIKQSKRKLERKVRERTGELKKANESLKKHIDEKNKLLSILAHDLRNPFASIIGYLQLLKKKFSETGNTEDLQMTRQLLQVSRNTHELLENLLKWSSAKRGGLEMNYEKTDIASLAEQAKNAVSSQSNFKNIDIDNRVPSDNYQVDCDPNMIETVIRNLVSNAVKFSEEGSTVRISAEKRASSIVVSVADQGEGIEEDDLDSILSFDNGNQKTGTQGEKGIGLGLLLCKEFIDKHHGRLWVESNKEEGGGSTFFFSLPT